MTKQEWQDLYNQLDRLQGDFEIENPNVKNGRNLKIRKEAKRSVDLTIQTAKALIQVNPEAYELFAGELGIGQASAEKFQDLGLPQYFDFDLNEYLKKIKEKIDSL